LLVAVGLASPVSQRALGCRKLNKRRGPPWPTRVGSIGEDEIVASRVGFAEETERDSYFRNRTSCLCGRR